MIASVVSNQDFQYLRSLRESVNWYKAQKDDKFSVAMEKERRMYKKALRGTASQQPSKKKTFLKVA